MIYSKDWFTPENMHFRKKLNRDATIFLGGIATGVTGAIMESELLVIGGNGVALLGGILTAVHGIRHERALDEQNISH